MLEQLGAIRRSHAAACGPKAANLGELVARGYAVPPAIVLPTTVYAEFLRRNGLDRSTAERESESRTVSPRGLAAIEQEIAAAFSHATLPPDVQTGIDAWMDRHGIARAAVRSSATAEDLPGASFAGLYSSFLDVPRRDVAAFVVKCFASLFSARAALYRRLKGLPGGGAMAVIVQQFVATDHAGVVFTAAPRRPRMLLIEGGLGCGDGVVSGTALANRYYLDRDTLSIEECNERVTIDHESVRAVARQALDIEAAFGVAQDVEYGVAGNVVHILQARPAPVR